MEGARIVTTARARQPVAERRAPLSRERVLRAAIDLADAGGLEAVSMRKLGQALRVEAMSLYKHVANKEDILDGMADLITGEIQVPAMGGDWRAEIRASAISAHRALLRHPWASSLIESRLELGPARLRYADAVIGVLTGAGFAMPVVARAFMALDSHTYGFTLQEQSWAGSLEEAPERAAALARQLSADDYPHLAAMAEAAGTSAGDFPLDFEFGLDMLLDGLQRLLAGGVADQPSSGSMSSAS
jgi:AcrR family transcriptional regulator